VRRLSTPRIIDAATCADKSRRRTLYGLSARPDHSNGQLKWLSVAIASDQEARGARSGIGAMESVDILLIAASRSLGMARDAWSVISPLAQAPHC
jgi:hypothetical protein